MSSSDPKDPQLYARVRRESEKKRKIAEAERAVLDGARRWFRREMDAVDLVALVLKLIEAEEGK